MHLLSFADWGWEVEDTPSLTLLSIKEQGLETQAGSEITCPRPWSLCYLTTLSFVPILCW